MLEGSGAIGCKNKCRERVRELSLYDFLQFFHLLFQLVDSLGLSGGGSGSGGGGGGGGSGGMTLWTRP